MSLVSSIRARLSARPARRSTLVRTLVIATLTFAAAGNLFCSHPPERVPSVPVASLPGHGSVAQDTAQMEELRLVSAEAYMRTYLQLFGGLAPLEVQSRARGKDGNQLFDTWDDYLAAIGLPDYRNDLPRGAQTNAIMVAAFERLGVALCDRALEHDLKGKSPPAIADRLVFAFELTSKTPSDAEFAERFDVLHRTFLGYPAALAETDRTARFHRLYDETVARHQDAKAAKSRFTPVEAGWANVCYGLVRHPEFQLY